MQILQQAMSNPRHPDREFHPVATQDEIDAALRAADAERAAAVDREPELAPHQAPTSLEAQLVDELRRFAITGTVVEFVPRPKHPPLPEAANAADRVEQMQLRESADAERVAEMLADVVYGVAGLDQLPRRERAACRFLAVHSMRRLKDYWNRAAEKAAVRSCADSLIHECGAAFRHLEPRHAESVAAILVGRVLSAYHGVTEGTAAMAPGQYLAITKGQQ